MKVYIPVFTPKFQSDSMLYQSSEKVEDKWINNVVVEKAKSKAGNDYVRIIADVDFLEKKIKEAREYIKSQKPENEAF